MTAWEDFKMWLAYKLVEDKIRFVVRHSRGLGMFFSHLDEHDGERRETVAKDAIVLIFGKLPKDS